MRKLAIALAASTLLLAGGMAASLAAPQGNAANQQQMGSQPSQQKMTVKKHQRVGKVSKKRHHVAKASKKRHIAKAGKKHHIAKSALQQRKLQARRPIRETTGTGSMSQSAPVGKDMNPAMKSK